MTSTLTPRMLTLADVAQLLSLSVSALYQLIKTDQIKALRVQPNPKKRGGLRIELDEVDRYIARLRDTRSAARLKLLRKVS